MRTIRLTGSDNNSLLKEVRERSGVDVSRCYQCGNCTAGCPYNFAYDIPVSRVMRLVQLGKKEEIISSHSVWLCASCQTCTTRCPNNIDVAHVMDVLRHMSREEGYATERNVKIFGDVFLESVAKHGRAFEVGLLAHYVAKTGRVWTDIDLAHKVLPKGKINFTPCTIKGAEHVAEIFRRYRADSGTNSGEDKS